MEQLSKCQPKSSWLQLLNSVVNTRSVMDDSPQLVEGEDYYLENGNYVFTATYLLKRGYCCESGCRHCPYGFVKSRIEPQTNAKERE